MSASKPELHPYPEFEKPRPVTALDISSINHILEGSGYRLVVHVTDEPLAAAKANAIDLLNGLDPTTYSIAGVGNRTAKSYADLYSNERHAPAVDAAVSLASVQTQVKATDSYGNTLIKTQPSQVWSRSYKRSDYGLVDSPLAPGPVRKDMHIFVEMQGTVVDPLASQIAKSIEFLCGGKCTGVSISDNTVYEPKS